MEVRLVFKANGSVETTLVSTPFLPKPPKQPLSLQATEPDWNDTWELLAECGADPRVFLPGEGGAIQVAPLFGALMDLGEAPGWTAAQIGALNKFLYALFSSLDSLSKDE